MCAIELGVYVSLALWERPPQEQVAGLDDVEYVSFAILGQSDVPLFVDGRTLRSTTSVRLVDRRK